MMWIVFFFLSSILIQTNVSIRIGSISSAIFLSNDNYSITINMNGSYLECACYSIEKSSSGFNYFLHNQTCSIFMRYSQKYTMSPMINATFYFFRLPSIGKQKKKRRYLKFLFFYRNRFGNNTFNVLWNIDFDK